MLPATTALPCTSWRTGAATRRASPTYAYRILSFWRCQLCQGGASRGIVECVPRRPAGNSARSGAACLLR